MARHPETSDTGAAETRKPREGDRAVNAALAVGIAAVVCVVWAGAGFLGGWKWRGGPPAAATSPVLRTGLEGRARKDAEAWLSHQGRVTFLHRNAVVFNFTVRMTGRLPARQFTMWYLRAPDGSLQLVGGQWLSVIGG